MASTVYPIFSDITAVKYATEDTLEISLKKQTHLK